MSEQKTKQIRKQVKKQKSTFQSQAIKATISLLNNHSFLERVKLSWRLLRGQL
jgi:hypothetical protein